MGDAPAVAELLDERPDLESALETVVSVDRAQGSWTFDDVDIDSGAFGELVNRGIVETHDGAYRLADPDAVRAALDGDGPSDGDRSLSSPSLSSLFEFDVDARSAAALAGALVFFIAFRLLSLPSVFREGAVVLSGNDPYYYRYWVERLLAEAGGAFDFSVLSGLPAAVAKGEPLMVATLWWASAIFGKGLAGGILAWYPVVAGVVAAVFVYLLSTELTNDRRVGLASVGLLAVTPSHALRTGLGYADHHAFDYPWLALTALALVALAHRRSALDVRRPATWGFAAALGVGVAGQVLAWEAGPLLVVPVGIAVALLALYDVRDGRSPALANAPLVAGLALGAALSIFFHTGFGWHTDQVAYTPALLLVGTAGVVAVAELVHRLELPVSKARLLAGLEAFGFVVGVLAFRTLLPTYWSRLASEVGYLFGQQAIAEVQPLFAANTFGFMLLFGWVLAVALLYMGWGVFRAYRGEDGARWAVVGLYAWYFLALASLQIRFAGELAHFTAVFAGLGVVHLAERIDVARPPVPFASGGETDRELMLPDARQAAALAVLFMLVASLGVVMVPVKTSQITIGEQQYGAAAATADYSEQHGLTYPDNYVLSPWSNNRMFNYFVNGESRSYGYARQNYGPFMTATDPDATYQRFGGRVGFVVTYDVAQAGPQVLHTRLHRNYGSRSGNVSGSGHYRAIHAAPDGSPKVFALVPGARVRGIAAPDETVTLVTNVSLDGTSFTYERRVQAAPNGSYSVAVAYPGTYRSGNETVSVPSEAVQNGSVVRV